MKSGRVASVFILGCLVTGCSTWRMTQPQRSGLEQLLMSKAADEAARHLTIDLKPGTKVFVNTDTFESYDQKYALGVIRNKILQSGADLVNDRVEADVIMDVRSGALSIDHNDMLVGIPSMRVPIPLASALNTPEIALFKRELDRGVAKFAITAYDRKTGELETTVGPVYGFSHRADWTVLFFISWTTDDTLPEDIEK